MTTNSIYINSHSGRQNSSSSLMVPRVNGLVLTSSTSSSNGVDWMFPASPVVQTSMPMFQEVALGTIDESQIELFGTKARLVRNGAMRILQLPTCNVAVVGPTVQEAVLEARDRPKSNAFYVISLHVSDAGKCTGLCGVASNGAVSLWPSLTKNDSAWEQLIGTTAGVDGFVVQWLA